MSISTPNPDEAVKPVLYIWIVNNDVYGELRKMDGCDTQIDLVATPKDCKEIMKFARKIRVPLENIIREENKTTKELNETYKFLR